MRPSVDTIRAPLFPTRAHWINTVAPVSTIQRGRPLLVELWDFCHPNSLRTLPYTIAWHQRYGPHALRVVGVHSPAYPPSLRQQALEEAVAALGISYPVLFDAELEVWEDYGPGGWPARYLLDGGGRIFHYHYGEGAYTETELAIQRLLDVQMPTLAPLRPEDVEGARVAAPTEDQLGPYCGPYEAGGVWAVLDGAGPITVNGRTVKVERAGAFALIEHERHTVGTLELEVGRGVECLAVCFTPGTI